MKTKNIKYFSDDQKLNIFPDLQYERAISP